MGHDLFHLSTQSDFSLVFGEVPALFKFQSSGKLALLKSATEKFELIEPVTLYSGHGNGAGALGGLGHSEASQFVGMAWEYRGFTSTSSTREIAESFLWKNARHPSTTPVLLQFNLSSGSKMLPMAELGADMTSEKEILLPPAVRYSVIEATRRPMTSIADSHRHPNGPVTDFLHLVLSR
jgi:hypothetical protein